MLALAIMLMGVNGSAWAQSPISGGMPGSCSDQYTLQSQIDHLNQMGQAKLATDPAGGQKMLDQAKMLTDMQSGNGFVSKTAKQINDTISDAAQKLYEGIIGGGFASLVASVLVLYVLIFAAMFTLGMVQAPLNEMLVRIVKMLVVASVVGPGGWTFFNDYVIQLFTSGRDYIIGQMLQTMASYTGGAVGTTVDMQNADVPVFAPIDTLFAQIIQPSTLMTLQAAIDTPPYGVIYVLILVVGGIFLIGAVARALWVYLVSVLAMSFLFGLAPLFVVTLLFERTKGMFQQWLAQIVNFTLQPILMFTFITFFVVLLDYSVKNMLKFEACFGELFSIAEAQGGSSTSYGLQFKVNDQVMVATCEASGCRCVTEQGGVETTCPGLEGGFPLNLMDVLSFLLLCYVAFQFYNNVVDIANDISGGFVNIDSSSTSPIRDMMDKAGSGVQGAAVQMLKGNSTGALQEVGLGGLDKFFNRK